MPGSQGESQEIGTRPTVETAAKRPDERSERFYWIWQLGDDSFSRSLVLGQWWGQKPEWRVLKRSTEKVRQLVKSNIIGNLKETREYRERLFWLLLVSEKNILMF